MYFKSTVQFIKEEWVAIPKFSVWYTGAIYIYGIIWYIFTVDFVEPKREYLSYSERKARRQVDQEPYDMVSPLNKFTQWLLRSTISNLC